MQSPSDADEARRAAAEQRLAEHLAWRRAFFQARPPPPPIGRLHRRQRGPRGGGTAAKTFQQACELLKTRQTTTGQPVVEAPEPPLQRPRVEVAASSDGAGTEEPVTAQAAWLEQMALERTRRNPFLDLHIRSDARRTVVMANLHPRTVEEEVRAFADQFGRVLGVRMVRNIKTGKSRRYAFVEFGLPAEARRAVQHSRQKRLRGHSIIIDAERGRTQPGFLPKRLATAAAVAAAAAAPAHRQEKGLGSGAQPDGADDIMDDEDALLASILGGG